MPHKIITFFTFCWVLCLPIYPQTMNIDSLISVVEKMPNDTANIRIIDEIGYEVGEDDLENALYFFRKAYKMAKQLKSDVWIPWVQINLGATFADLGKSDSALMYFQAAQKIYEQQGNKLAIRKVFEKMSWLHEYLGEYDKALNYSFKALNISEITKDEKNTAENFLAVSDILSAQKKYKEALIYAEKAYNIQKRIKDWEGLSFSAQSISIIWIELEDYEKAFAYIEEALEPQKSFENKSDLPYLRETRGEVFLHLKKYSEALADFQYSLAFAQKSRNLELELQCISNMGHAYNLLGQYKRALPYHLECYRRLSENKVGAMTDINLSWLAEAYAGIKKYDSAYYFYKLYKTVDDSLLGFDNQSKMNELRIKYETEKKEEQISEQNRNLWLLGGALGMAVLGGAGLFFLTYKLRKRNT